MNLDIDWQATHAISVRQPWADHILYDGKDVENRTWKLPDRWLGRPLWLHAGKKHDGYGAWWLPDRTITSDRLGAIVGQVIFDTNVVAPDWSTPWFSGPIGWYIAWAKPLDKPIRGPGALGIFPVKGFPIP